ncbi:MAG: DoxX family protein [Pseudomonadota bacterium]|nr:DoxX family protein [Pseudomonadota bacterium]
MNPTTADDIGKLILRLTLGVLMLFHGVGKLLGGVGGIAGMVQGIGLPASLAYGVYIGEVLAPILVVLGWYARVGAGLIVANMLVAILLAHPTDILTLGRSGGWGLELQGFFLFTALALAFTGPGRLSINQR